jgi:hypothetical protein
LYLVQSPMNLVRSTGTAGAKPSISPRKEGK